MDTAATKPETLVVTPKGSATNATVHFSDKTETMISESSSRRTVVNVVNKLLGFKKKDTVVSQDAEEEDEAQGGDIMSDTLSRRKTRKTRTKAGKSKNSVLAELQAEEAQRQLEIFEHLTISERAFLPATVREKLSLIGNLPTTPLQERSRGVVLYADISGFTNLGRELRAQYGPLEAASKLAIRIGSVLRELTNLCHEFEGDVAKFAGDALLCVWENHEDSWMVERAKACAVSMLAKVKEVDGQLDLHGGIALGDILHIHLGDRRQEMLWYLLAGDASVRAANLVDEAQRGHILFEMIDQGGTVREHIVNSDLDLGMGAGDEGAPARGHSIVETLTLQTKTKIIPVKKRSVAEEEISEAALNVSNIINNNDKLDSAQLGGRSRTSTADDPFINMKLPSRGRAYIPKDLRNVLKSGLVESGEMRNRVAILFAAFPSLILSEEEMRKNVISDERLGVVNDTFSQISVILRHTDGEFRDLLFDDKGCIFIAVFGAFGSIEMPELKALRAAKRMHAELEVDDLKIGVSVGTCFVGLVGNDVRHDMIVMGNDVNMAARYMAKAPERATVVGPKIYESTKDFYEFEHTVVELKKYQGQDLTPHPSTRRFDAHENDLTGEVQTRKQSVLSTSSDPNLTPAYIPKKEIARRASFTALYRYPQVISDQFFVGRKSELQKLQGHLNKAVTNKTASFCMVSGPRGYGKSWLIREFRHRMDEKYTSTLGVAFELNVFTPLFVFRQILENLYEIYEGMPQSKIKAVLATWTQAGVKFDNDLLGKLFPYIMKFLPESKKDRRTSQSNMSSFRGMLRSMKITSSNSLHAQAAAENAAMLEEAGNASPTLGPDTLARRSSSSTNNPPIPPSTPHVARQSSQEAQLDKVGSRRRLISTRNLLGPPKTQSIRLNEASTVTTSGATTSPHEKTPELDLRKKLKRKESRVQTNLVMGKKELDPIVAFINNLLQFAASECARVGKKGLVLVLEDIQWLDVVSLQVLNDIIDKMIANPRLYANLFILGSCRNADPDKPDDQYFSADNTDVRPLLEQRFLERSRDLKVYNLVEVDVLSRDEVDNLVSKLLVKGTGDSVSSEVLDAVFNNSGGMPNAIADVIDLIKTNGAVYLDPNTNQWKWKTVKNKKTGYSVLYAARQAYVSRIDNLSIDTKDILKIAACVCDSKLKFKLQDLVDVIEKDLETKSRYVKAGTHVPSVDFISHRLQDAIVAGLVKYRKGFLSAVEEWSFASSAIAESVLEMVPTDRRDDIKEMKQGIDLLQKGHAADGLLRDFLVGNVY